MISFLNLNDYGRFGNRLFFIAGTIGLAMDHHYAFGFGAWQESEYFENSLPALCGDMEKYSKTERIKRKMRVPFGWQPDIFLRDNVFLFGFMQSELYFKHHEKTIRKYFTLKHMLLAPVPEKSICLHFRGTDYRMLNFPICSRDYYLKALDMIPADYAIYVFSDEVDTVLDMLYGTRYYDRIVLSGGNYMEDFYQMTQCRHFIISNSTFSWWAAWLGTYPDKQVIAPANWYAAYMEKNEFIYCKDWMVI